MACQPCDVPTGWEPGQMGNCPECDSFRWFPGSGDRLYKVPGLNQGNLPIVEVSHERHSLVRNLEKPRKVRLPGAIRYYRGAVPEKRKQSKIPSHIEELLGMDKKPRGKGKGAWDKRLEHVREILGEFGLQATQLLKGAVNGDEPLLLHWVGRDPFASFPPFMASPDSKAQARAERDPMWDRYSSDIDMFNNFFGNPFRPKQREAIERVLEKKGTLQIVALPTGYGKTRIAQTVTRVLREYGEGPTLMISPLVALRDDQREGFEEQMNRPFMHYGDSGFDAAFLTAAAKGQDTMAQRLIRDELDMMCCAPEHILVPSFHTSWFEVFHRMEKPFSTLVVDEAHLIGDWGSSFRSQFLLLGQLKDRLLEMNPGLRVILQSATITKGEEAELKRLFDGLEVLDTVRILDTRDDLHFRVELESSNQPAQASAIDYEQWANRLLDEWEAMPTEWTVPWVDTGNMARSPLLIYSAIREGVVVRIESELKKRLDPKRVRVFTGDTPPGQKDVRRRAFKGNEMDALVATSAFGMGIDKEDVWLIGYLGLPFTLKGLYQGFGRAARGSNWDGSIPGAVPRNGSCLAVLPDLEKIGKARAWRPELSLEKTVERIWDLVMSNGSVLLPDRGYLVAPVLDGLHANSCWLSSPNTVQYYLPQEDEEDDELDITWTTEDWKEAERRYGKGRTKRFELNRNFRLWALACLQREVDTGRFASVLGFYPEYLLEDNTTGERVSLAQALKEGGHERVREVMRSIDPASGTFTRSPQQRMALIRFDKPSSGWEAVVKALTDGHDNLRDRHRQGNEELELFMEMVRKPDCIRKAFAPAIGGEIDEADDCCRLLELWHQEPDKKKEKQQPPTPCSHCMSKPEFEVVL